MLETQNNEQDRRESFLVLVALSLVVAVVLVLAGAVVSSGRFGTSLSTRSRVELVGDQGANIVSTALLLGAIVALAFLPAARLKRARPLLLLAFVVGTVLALLATYSVVDILTIHIPSVNSNDIIAVGISSTGSFGDRLGAVLPAVASAFVAVVAMIGANRLAHPRSTAAHPWLSEAPLD